VLRSRRLRGRLSSPNWVGFATQLRNGAEIHFDESGEARLTEGIDKNL